MRELTAVEARALGVLVEKQSTVPDSYPLSLNALVAGCNQRSARQPVMTLSEPEVLDAVETLRALSLVVEVSGSRVVRFEHNAGRVLGLPSQAVALIAVLLLRGPQTAAELRLNSERLHRFADVSSVEGFLDEMASKPEPWVERLPRAPGEREPRWAHRLCGAPDVPTVPDVGSERTESSSDRWAALEATVAALADGQARLEAEVAALRARLARLDGAV